MKIKFLVLTNGKNLGDDNNAISVAQHTLKNLSCCFLQNPWSIEIVNTTRSEVSLVISDLNSQMFDFIFIIGAGEHHLNYFEKLKLEAQTTTIWLSHQPCEAMAQAFPHINYFVLPKALLNSNTFESVGLEYDRFKDEEKLLPIELIPHDKTFESIRIAYEQWPAKFTEQKNIILLLGGDAPLPGGKDIKFFTAAEARLLADKVAVKASSEERFIYITNGPRTGQYNHTSGQKLEQARKETEPEDEVTQAFRNQLQNCARTTHNIRFELFDFKFLASGKVKSALAPLYHHALSTDSFLYIPGETISSISEVVSLGLGKQMEIYLTGSMNENHHKFVNNLKEKVLDKIPSPAEEVAGFLSSQLVGCNKLETGIQDE